MRTDVPATDWKHFKTIRELALQKLCERALNHVVEVAGGSSNTPHERYLEVFAQIHNYDKKIASAFNDLSRSKMIMHLAIMQSLKLVEESQLEAFTQETRDHLNLFASYHDD